MKLKLTILFMFITLLCFSQKFEEEDFRKVSGIIKGYDIPKDGLLVSYVGLNYAVISDSEGKFCLTVPKNKSVFVEVPICMAKSLTEIKADISFIVINLDGSSKSLSKILESEKSWAEQKDKLIPDLKLIYNSSYYKRVEKNICW